MSPPATDLSKKWCLLLICVIAGYSFDPGFILPPDGAGAGAGEGIGAAMFGKAPTLLVPCAYPIKMHSSDNTRETRRSLAMRGHACAEECFLSSLNQ